MMGQSKTALGLFKKSCCTCQHHELDLEEYATYTSVNSKILVHKITITALLQEVAFVLILESDSFEHGCNQLYTIDAFVCQRNSTSLPEEFPI